MILGAIIIGAVIYFIYIPYKAWRLKKNPEWIENQMKIKKLEAEYEELEKAQEKLSEAATASSQKGREAYLERVDTDFRKAFPNLNTKPDSSDLK
jgi:hypothetical protein